MMLLEGLHSLSIPAFMVREGFGYITIKRLHHMSYAKVVHCALPHYWSPPWCLKVLMFLRLWLPAI